MNTKAQINKAIKGSTTSKLSITKIGGYKDLYEEYQVKYGCKVVATYLLKGTDKFTLSDSELSHLISTVKGTCEMLTSDLMSAFDKAL